MKMQRNHLCYQPGIKPSTRPWNIHNTRTTEHSNLGIQLKAFERETEEEDIPIEVPNLDNKTLIEANEKSIIVRLLNPETQNVEGAIKGLPVIWKMRGRTWGRSIGADKVQFMFKTMEDVEYLLRESMAVYEVDGGVRKVVSKPYSGLSSLHSFLDTCSRNPNSFSVKRNSSMFRVTSGKSRENRTTCFKFKFNRVCTNASQDSGRQTFCFSKKLKFTTGEVVTTELEYERLHRICFYCRKISHDVTKCHENLEGLKEPGNHHKKPVTKGRDYHHEKNDPEQGFKQPGNKGKEGNSWRQRERVDTTYARGSKQGSTISKHRPEYTKNSRYQRDQHHKLRPDKTERDTYGQLIRFRALEKPKEDEFVLKLSKLNTYDDVVERVAHKLGLDDPSKIRLTSHNCYSQQPKPYPIKYRGVDHLSDMLVHYNRTSDILYYEVLDIPLQELEGLKTLKVAFHHATKDEVVIHNIRLPKQSNVRDLMNELKTKVELSHPDAELRLLEVFYHKIYKIFPSIERIENINDQHWTLRAEEIPEEEKHIDPNDRLIHVYHFTKESGQNQEVQNFGEPFFLVIHEGETLEEVKSRIQKKLHVPDEDFSKWKFASFSLGRPEYLQDTDIVYNRFQRRDVYGAWEQYLGLEHIDNAPKRA